MAIIPNQNFWNIIIIIIAFDTLYNNINITTTSFLKIENKIINKIQNILQSKKIKNISKYIIKEIKNLAIAFKNNNNAFKKKTNNYKKYFNYHKLGHL